MGEYAAGVIRIYDNTTPTPLQTVIGALVSQDVSANAELTADDGGSLYDKSLSITQLAPTASLSSKAIAAILGIIGLDGQCVGAGQLVTRVDVIARALKDCKTTLSGTPHYQLACQAGLLRLGSLTANRGEDATITVLLDALTDGTNAPLVETDGVAMPSNILAAQYTLGVCSIGGVTFDDIDGVSIDFGVNTSGKTPALASIYPDTIGVESVRPKLTLRGRSINKMKAAAIPLTGKAAAHANTKVQLVKRANQGAFVANGTAQHITLTFYGMVVPDQVLSASGKNRASNSLMLQAADDGTNAPIVISTSATYNPTP